ncbi:3-hydroxyacyl-CoA dehydrogenase [Xanthobacter sp. ZOL 2024]
MTRELTTIGVVGTGTMGRGIVQVMAQAGYRVRMFDGNRAAADNALAFIADMLKRAAAKGTLSAESAQAATDRIVIAESLADMGDADLVIEAVAERLDVKIALFRELEGIVAADAILATNTSSLSVTAVAAGCARPGRVAGFHFFNPVPLQKVVEIIAGERTEEAVMAALFAVSVRCGHQAVRCIDSPGFLINHAGRGLYTEGLRVVQEGVSDPLTVDRIMRDAVSFRMGTFELFDLTGLDVSFAVTELIYNQFYQDPRLRPSPLPPRRIAAGLYGRKVGEGFYAYPDGRQVVPAEPAAPDVALRPVWVSRAEAALAAPVVAYLKAAGVPLDEGERPGPEALALVTPVGQDATSAARAQGLDPTRTAAVDPLYFEGRITLMLTVNTAAAHRDALHAALARGGRPVSVINDSVGFVAQRIVATIVNISCEIAQQRIAEPGDIDTFVRIGLGYPKGPLSLGEAIGPAQVLRILEGMQDFYGDPRYRPSAWLKRRALTGLPLVTPEAARG